MKIIHYYSKLFTGVLRPGGRGGSGPSQSGRQGGRPREGQLQLREEGAAAVSVGLRTPVNNFE